MNITFSRARTPLRVLRDGVVIGDIRRAANNRNYILTLRGVCWRKGIPASSGPVSVWTDRLAKAKVLAVVHGDLAK